MKEVCEKLYQKDEKKVMPVVVDSRTNRARYYKCLLKEEFILKYTTIESSALTSIISLQWDYRM